MIWSRIGRTSPLHVADFPGGKATVQRGEGGRWTATVTVTVEAGNPESAKLHASLLVSAIETAQRTLAEAPTRRLHDAWRSLVAAGDSVEAIAVDYGRSADEVRAAVVEPMRMGERIPLSDVEIMPSSDAPACVIECGGVCHGCVGGEPCDWTRWYPSASPEGTVGGQGCYLPIGHAGEHRTLADDVPGTTLRQRESLDDWAAPPHGLSPGEWVED